MYSGSTLTKYSGRIMGAHQKIDRIARRDLARFLVKNSAFPPIRLILQFEGGNGPDAIKRKSPAHDEPWHYFDPFDDDDIQLMTIISDHFRVLVNELQSGNRERAAFESAWLAHALVDGLTPAHHYPYEEELVQLSGGQPIESRTSLRKKLVMPGVSVRDQLRNNWRAWGPRGLRTAHGLFEVGVATLIAPLTFSEAAPRADDLARARQQGLLIYFKAAAREIAVLDMYRAYVEKGWTPKLAYQVRHQLGPIIVRCVTIGWYLASLEAGLLAAG